MRRTLQLAATRAGAPLRRPGGGQQVGAAVSVAALAVLAALFLLTSASQAADLQRMQQAAQRQGANAVAGVRALQAVLSAAADWDDERRLLAVNQFYNRRIQFRTDWEVWGQADYWASPLELLEKGQGDCEDYVIAKYFSLLSIGMPSANLRLVYVRAQIGGPGGTAQAHMVLAYYPPNPSANAEPPGLPAEPLILDNLIAEIRPASLRPDLSPVFSFNSEGLWKGVSGAPDGDPSVRVSRWRDVLNKARAEGFL